MISFNNDYSEGAHERILEKLGEINHTQVLGYGADPYCDEAREFIKSKLHNDKSEVHFLVGGTQTNTTAISAFLRPYQGVISADTGHINVHETGAIEAIGHKVLTIQSVEGKINAEQVECLVSAHYADNTAEHTVQPGMVYISNSTECGTIYTKAEISAISKVCKKYNMVFFVDGARLLSALAAKGNDVTLDDLASLTDAFYIGGTKMGVLFGEALVINNPALNKDFRYMIKRHGGMLAKGWLLGVQFAELFRDTLYIDLPTHANNMAEILTNGIEQLGYGFSSKTPTNQIFPLFPDSIVEKLSVKYIFATWEKANNSHTTIRLCTSWATEKKYVHEFLEDLKSIS